MPLSLNEAFIVDADHVYCENCYFFREPLGQLVPREPAGATVCTDCGIYFGPHAPWEEAAGERVSSAGGVCYTCNTLREVVHFCACLQLMCVEHVSPCVSCGTAVCDECVRTCRCNRHDRRCASCGEAHVRRCLSQRAPAAPSRPPSFAFLCDSEDETVVRVKHVRPLKTSVSRLVRPAPGVFVVSGSQRSRAGALEEEDDEPI